MVKIHVGVSQLGGYSSPIVDCPTRNSNIATAQLFNLTTNASSLAIALYS